MLIAPIVLSNGRGDTVMKGLRKEGKESVCADLCCWEVMIKGESIQKSAFVRKQNVTHENAKVVHTHIVPHNFLFVNMFYLCF
jgi:hypothetical protein